MLDRILRYTTSLADGGRLTLVFLDATARSNLTVGLPYDLAIYVAGRFRLAQQGRIEEGSTFHGEFSDAWQQDIEAAFTGLLRFDREGEGNP